MVGRAIVGGTGVVVPLASLDLNCDDLAVIPEKEAGSSRLSDDQLHASLSLNERTASGRAGVAL